MIVPTNITEPPMRHTKQESLLESKGKKHLISLELIKHVFKTVMGLFDDKQVEDLSHWIHYREYYNFLMACMTHFTITQRVSTDVKNINGRV